LLDVINQAYKPPPIHIDLTLDDSEEEPDKEIECPANVWEQARVLDRLLASDDEGNNAEDAVQREFLLYTALITSVNTYYWFEP
jgi:hypothetical protein